MKLSLIEKPIQSWSIIILCYNEEGNIEKVIKGVQQLLPLISTGSGQVLVVNDGSSDNSHAVIQQLIDGENYNNLLYKQHHKNLGIGEALRTGYAHATEENVAMIPGDGQFDLRELIPYREFAENTFLSFYRLENTTYGIRRNILSWFNTKLNKIFIGIELKDVNWINAYKTADLKKLDLKIRSSLIESEISSKLSSLGHQVIEIDSKYHSRTSGENKGASLKIVRQAAMDMLQLIVVCQGFKRTHSN